MGSLILKRVEHKIVEVRKNRKEIESFFLEKYSTKTISVVIAVTTLKKFSYGHFLIKPISLLK